MSADPIDKGRIPGRSSRLRGVVGRKYGSGAPPRLMVKVRSGIGMHTAALYCARCGHLKKKCICR